MKKKNLSDYKRFQFLDGIELLYARNHTLDFPNHTHDTFNIALVLNQSFNARLPSRSVTAPVGTLCITNPDEVHATPCDKITGNTFTTFYISPDVMAKINDNHPVFFEDKVVDDKKLFAVFYRLAQDNTISAVDFERSLISALTYMVREYASKAPFSRSQSRRFRQFLAEESLEKFSLEKTARAFGMDKYKFLRLFKQETGLTPNSLVIMKRIESAKKLILSDNDLLDVAVSTGFYDAAHLAREFKKYTGVTPGTYRG